MTIQQVESILAARMDINRKMISNVITPQQAEEQRKLLYRQLPEKIRLALASELEWIPEEIFEKEHDVPVQQVNRTYSDIPLPDENEEDIHPAIMRKHMITPARRIALDLIAVGATREQIAYIMGVSKHTAKHHITSGYQALGVHGYLDAVRVWREWRVVIGHTPNQVLLDVFSQFKNHEPQQDLSEEESRVMDVMAQGVTIQGAAEALDMSSDMVRRKLRKIYAKLGTHSKREAVVAWLYRKNQIED